MIDDQELPKEEADRRAREVAQRMLTTPKLKKVASHGLEKPKSHSPEESEKVKPQARLLRHRQVRS